MSKIILSINAGSSSVKISVFKASKDSEPQQLAEIQVDGLTAPPPKLKYTRGSESVCKDKELSKDINSQDEAFKHILDTLINDKDLKEISKPEDIAIACHRVVHGGDYKEAKLITKETYHHLEELTDLAPLHNSSALQIIKTCHSTLPQSKNIAYFDSQFHQTIPKHITTYPIDQEVANKNSLRKYGFHGISYSFITRSVAAYLNKPVEETSIIALHLGSGASACCVKDGKSHNTTMGLTPLSGLPGATRSGDIDPSLVFHYASNVGKLSPSSTKDLHISRAEEILNKESGWKALTGTTDMGDITSKAADGDENCQLALDIFIDRICGYVGSYFVSLGGKVDALVFAGGIGEKSEIIRTKVVESCACLGFKLDAGKNKEGGEDIVYDISADAAEGKKVLVCATDEQFEMARGCCFDGSLWE